MMLSLVYQVLYGSHLHKCCRLTVLKAVVTVLLFVTLGIGGAATLGVVTVVVLVQSWYL